MKDHVFYLKRTIELAKQAVKHGNTPFGALLVDHDGNILLEQENIEITEKDCTGHAETALMRKASKLYSKDFLWNCTIYTSVEPCAMCSGAIYWGNVGKVVYGISEKELLNLTGNNKQNPTLDLSCRKIFEHGQKEIEVEGPITEIAKDIMEIHRKYW
ncbi:MAG: nucleoside deaminase [Candidatus Cloacimonadota bacterium]|nr:nucleoside deaminase [Candidatus Cloacimonadota bacterium]